MKNIFIIGRVKGNYRTQYLIKSLLDCNYYLHYNSLQTRRFKNKQGLEKILRYFVRGFEESINFLFKIYYISISDIVILPAMCNEFQIDLKIAKALNKKVLCDFYISFYDTFILDRKRFLPNSFEARKMLKQDRNIIQKANLVMFLNTTEARRYLELVDIPYDEKKHITVPLVVEQQTTCKLPYFNSSKRERKNFTICWWGSYIPLHGLENIILACKVLKESQKIDFRLYLFGTSDNEAAPYQKQIDNLGLNDVIEINNSYSFNNGKLGEFLENNCDLVLGNFGTSDKARNVLVNKLIDGVAIKAPVLTGESKAPLEFFSSNEIFYCQNNPHSIAENILLISKTNPNDVKQQTNRAYQTYIKYFSVNAFEKRMHNIFNNIL